MFFQLSVALCALVVLVNVEAQSTRTFASLPFYITKHREPVSAIDNLGPAQHTDFTTTGARYGHMHDETNFYAIYRDGGGSCALNNRTFWFFCDTSAYGQGTHTVQRFASNSAAVATNFNTPTVLRDFTLTGSTVAEAIPFMPEELENNNADYSQRWALWTYSNCVRVSESIGAHFWQVMKFRTNVNRSLMGNTLALYQQGNHSNNLIVSRDNKYMFTMDTYLYGTFANLVVNGYAYLYALDYTHSDRMDIHVARVPVTGIRYKSNYQYYDAGADTWSSTPPVADQRRRSAAVIKGTIGFYSGAMFYSEYHNAYLLVFMSNWADNQIRVLYSASPLGPWLGNNKVIYRTVQGPNGINYGGIVSPIYFNNALPQGKNLLLLYSYRDVTYVYPFAVIIRFA
ncbi:hypothetical protein V1512DRAFT_251592 [Lipomyces arxii]|uniref:uncharacterized protein n=1 Tax=Lipomyces arxii TaxID=56418 RepID=UPI0034CDB8A5